MTRQRNCAWLVTIIAILVAVFFIVRGSIKNIATMYGIALIIMMILPFLVAILLTLRIKLPHLFCNLTSLGLYVVFLIGIGLSYENQNWIDLIFAIIALVFFILLGMLVAMIRTFRSRKNGKYYFTEEDHNQTFEYDNFGQAYKKYLLSTLVEGIWDALFTGLL